MGIFGKPPDQKPGETLVPSRPSPPPPLSNPAPVPASAAAATAARPTGPTPTNCLIGPKTTLKGEISGEEDLVVEGSVEGEIHITSDLRVGPKGVVKATVEARAIIVSGEVVGDCVAADRVEIQASGRLTGNIRAPKIVIAEGAMFRGNSDMTSRDRDRRDEKKEEKKVAIL